MDHHPEGSGPTVVSAEFICDVCSGYAYDLWAVVGSAPSAWVFLLFSACDSGGCDYCVVSDRPFVYLC